MAGRGAAAPVPGCVSSHVLSAVERGSIRSQVLMLDRYGVPSKTCSNCKKKEVEEFHFSSSTNAIIVAMCHARRHGRDGILIEQRE